MALSDKQEKITLNKLSAVRRIEDDFTRQLNSTLRRLERQLTSYFSANLISAESGAVDVALSRANLEQILLQSGYYETAGALLNDGYQSAINESYEQYQELYKESLQFSEVSLRQLDAFKSLDLTQFKNIGDTALAETNRLLTDVQFGTMSFNDAIKKLGEEVIDKMQRHANTWITTGLSGIYSTANVTLAEDAGIERFQYIGPNDNKTRDFCRKYLGQIMTREQWDSIPGGNGQIDPVSSFRGGYNCRHQLIGVVDAK
jgi:hypothetical protein